MKHIFFSLVFFVNISLFAQSAGDKITGYYLNVDPFSDAVSQVKIYKATDGTYEAVVVWTKDADRKKYEGLVFLTELTYDAEDNEWKDGICIYPGKKGKYRLDATIQSNGNLKVRGYWGVSLLGKTVYWTKESKSRKAN